MKHITERGKWIAHVDERDGMKIVTDAKGQIVARVINDKTFDAKGKYIGDGDSSMRLIKKSF